MIGQKVWHDRKPSKIKASDDFWAEIFEAKKRDFIDDKVNFGQKMIFGQRDEKNLATFSYFWHIWPRWRMNSWKGTEHFLWTAGNYRVRNSSEKRVCNFSFWSSCGWWWVNCARLETPKVRIIILGRTKSPRCRIKFKEEMNMTHNYYNEEKIKSVPALSSPQENVSTPQLRNIVSRHLIHIY